MSSFPSKENDDPRSGTRNEGKG
jgi:hypothetical protein